MTNTGNLEKVSTYRDSIQNTKGSASCNQKKKFFNFFISVLKIQNSLTLIHYLITKSEKGIILILKYIT